MRIKSYKISSHDSVYKMSFFQNYKSHWKNNTLFVYCWKKSNKVKYIKSQHHVVSPGGTCSQHGMDFGECYTKCTNQVLLTIFLSLLWYRRIMILNTNMYVVLHNTIFLFILFNSSYDEYID